jgi:hypothetical protein
MTASDARILFTCVVLGESRLSCVPLERAGSLRWHTRTTLAKG